MPEFNQGLYNAAREWLEQTKLPEHISDAAARIVATDDPSQDNFGRLPIDIEICRQAAEAINQSRTEKEE